jgi:hypothetical protein
VPAAQTGSAEIAGERAGSLGTGIETKGTVSHLVRFAPHVVAALASLAARDASARDSLRLDWAAPAGCPTAEAVHAAALRGAGSEPRGPLEPVEPVLEASAQVTSVQVAGVTRWTVQLRTRQGEVTGERTVEATTCAGVAEAAAVVLAIALLSPAAAAETPAATRAPVRDLERGPPSRASRAGPALLRSQPPFIPPQDAASGATPAAHQVAFGMSAIGDAATLPSPAVGASFTLAWQPGRARIELEARTWAPQTHTLEAFAAGARFSMTSLGARGCWAVWRSALGRVEFGACAGVDLQRVAAPGRGVDSSYDASAAWAALTPGGLGRLVLTPWLALRARLEGSVPLSRPRFVIEGAGDLHRPAALSAGAAFGMELSFF